MQNFNDFECKNNDVQQKNIYINDVANPFQEN